MDGRQNYKEQASKVKRFENSKLDTEDTVKSPTVVLEQSPGQKMVPTTESEASLHSQVLQLQELIKCTDDQAITALYDCENNLERAVELLLDKFRYGMDEEWHTTVSKRSRTKNVVPNGASAKETLPNANYRRQTNRSSKSDRANSETQPNEKKSPPSSPNKIPHLNTDLQGKKGSRNRRTNQQRKMSATRNRNQHQAVRQKEQNSAPNCMGFPPRRNQPNADVWDPYADCGDWGDEPIEIVNSNVSIAVGLQEKSLSDEQFHDDRSEKTEREENSDLCANGVPDITQVSVSDLDALFASTAQSKQPPRAFSGLPDVELFFSPEVMPSNLSRKPKFGCDSFKVFLSESLEARPDVNTQCMKDLIPPANTTIDQADINKQFSFNSHASNAPSFELKNASPLTALLENSAKCEEKQNTISNDFTNRHFEESVVQKVPSYPDTNKKQPVHLATSTSDQSIYLEPTIKNYLLDGLSENMEKLNVEEVKVQSSKSAQFNLHQPASQSQQTHSSFPHAQNSAVSMPHPLNKMPQAHPNTHVPAHTQPMTTNSQQTHPQQSTTLPPGMPHFISQFTPAAYHMFNLHGGSNAGPALFDLDHLQLLQQRLIYDMHLQHHTVTTTQNMPQNQDTATSGKSLSHNLPGAMAHVTAANTGVRSDILTPTIGHTPQMVTPGHPYFPYPGFVVMNGYPNAFVNQQQQQPNADNAQSQSSGHCGSPIAQHQPQPTNPVPSFNNLKQMNAGVGNYEDILDMKYGDPTKQVGFKTNSNQPNYGSFQSQSMAVDNVGNKLPGNHSGSGSLNQNFVHPNNNTHAQHFSPQFYPSVATASPYLTAVAAAAVAAASAKQASNNNNTVGANQSNPANVSGNQAGVANSGSNQLHMSNNPAQGMVLGSSGPGLHHHHQRTAIPHQH